MRLILNICIVLGLAFMLVRCDGPTAVSVDDGTDPALGKVGVTVETFVFDANGLEDFVGCINDGNGEPVVFFGALDFEITTRMTPSGHVKEFWKTLYSLPLGFTGGITGDVWTLVKGNQNAKEFLRPDVNQWRQFKLNEWWMNEDGATLHAGMSLRQRWDADGKMVFEQFGIMCSGPN